MVQALKRKMSGRSGRLVLAAGLTIGICALLAWSLTPPQQAPAGYDAQLDNVKVYKTLEIMAGSTFTLGSNLTLSDTIDLLPATAGGNDLGSAALEWGAIYMLDSKALWLGSDQDASIMHDGSNLLIESDQAVHFQIGGVNIFALDDSALTLAAATDTAGQDLYLQTEDAGGTATAAKAGGLLELRTGDGSLGATTVIGGAGGLVGLASGAGGAQSGTKGGGAGAEIDFTAGIGGACSGAGGADSDGGVGGKLDLNAGAGGATAATNGSADGGIGGAVELTAGIGGTGNTGDGGAGGTLTLASGAGAGGTADDGDGGAVTITAGQAGGSDAIGGAVTIDAGAANGGTAGAVTVGGTNAASTTIGRAGQATTINGKIRMDRRTAMEQYYEFDFDAGATEPLPWVEDILTAGTVDFMADEPLGALQLAQTAGNAAEAQQITWGNQRLIDTDNNPIIEFRIRVDNIAGFTSVERLLIGVVADHTAAEDTKDNIDHSCWFMLKGATATDVYVESDDGAADVNDQVSGQTIADDTYVLFRIDMSTLADIKMYVNETEQTGGTLNMASSSGQVLQPIVCFQRDDNSQTEAVMQVEIDYIQITQDR